MINLHSERTIVSVPSGLENSMHFSRAGKTDAAQPQVVKVWSINYSFAKGFETPFIDSLEVEIIDGAKKAVIKNKLYAEVIKMDGGKDAVTKFGLFSYEPIEKAEIGYIHCR